MPDRGRRNRLLSVWLMNFGMPPDLIDEFLVEIRSRADEAEGEGGERGEIDFFCNSDDYRLSFGGRLLLGNPL